MRKASASLCRIAVLALALLLASSGIAAAASSSSAISAPGSGDTQTFRTQLEQRQAQLKALNAQLDALDREAEIAAEQYDGAFQALADTQTRLDAKRADLAAAQYALDQQTTLLAQRVDSLYRDNGTTNADVLLTSRSINDFLSRLQSITTISEADAGLATQLASQRDIIASQQIDLEKAQLEAKSLEFTLKARKLEIGYRIADRQKVLLSTQSDLLALLDTESKRRIAEEMGLWRSILAGAQNIGVTVSPRSPVETALAYHGIPYLWGGATPAGFDCSGLMMYVMAQHGVKLPHYAASQYLLGTKVSPGDLQPGDLVFFGSPVYHVGMYIGGGYFIQAPRTGDYVKISRLADRADFVGARRYPWRPRVGPPAGVSSVSK